MNLTYCVDEKNVCDVAKGLDPYLIPGSVICLEGPLGAGKTTLVRSCLKQLMGHDVDVTSPTFTLCQSYDTPRGVVYHYDLYRLERAEEVFEIGLLDFLSDSISFIEWPGLILPFLPASKIGVTISCGSATNRLFSVQTQQGK
jgi:tRNA threonylcarbamoyl adenosine modification protein YjeE